MSHPEDLVTGPDDHVAGVETLRVHRTPPRPDSTVNGHHAFTAFTASGDLGGILDSLTTLPQPLRAFAAAGTLTAVLADSGEPHQPTWSSPDAVSTWMLPAEAADVAGVRELDSRLRAAQRAVFGFEDGPGATVWTSDPPAALRVDSPQVRVALSAWLNGIAAQAGQLLSQLADTGEPALLAARDRLTERLDELKNLGDTDEAIRAQLTAASEAAERWYSVVLAENRLARMALAGPRRLPDGAGTVLEAEDAAARSALAAANTALAELAGPPPPTIPAAPGERPLAALSADLLSPAVPAVPPAVPLIHGTASTPAGAGDAARGGLANTTAPAAMGGT